MTSQQCVEKVGADVKECLACLKTPLAHLDTYLRHPRQGHRGSLGQQFGLHPLAPRGHHDLRTAFQVGQLQRHYCIIVTQMFGYNEEKQQAEDEQVSIVLGENYRHLLCGDRKRACLLRSANACRNPQSRIRQRSVDYLCYSLLDCIVDNYFLHFGEDRCEGGAISGTRADYSRLSR